MLTVRAFIFFWIPLATLITVAIQFIIDSYRDKHKK